MTHGKTTIAVIALIALSCSTGGDRISTAGMTAAPYHEVFAEGRAVAVEAGRNILVDFYTDW